MEAISSVKEYELTVELLRNYRDTDNTTNTDTNYISSWILGVPSGSTNEETKDRVLISDIIGKIMIRFEYLSGVHCRNTGEIFVQLYFHFRPTYCRLLCRPLIFNPLYDKVREERRELYQLMEETMKSFHAVFGGDIPAEEIAYLVTHLASIYSGRKAFEITKQRTALVVCSNGVGSSAILHNELTGMFLELHFLPPLETLHIHDVKEHVDIVFSTSYVSLGVGIHTLAIQVSPVMSIAEHYQIMHEIYMQMESHFLKQPSVDVMMGIIAEHADTQNEHVLYNELITYLSYIDTTTQEERVLRLTDMVKLELIHLHMDADYWEEATQKAYEPMVQHGYIMQNYVEEITNNVRIVGPYIVITKHVALPRVGPEARALSAALGADILNSAIKFGNRDNDPVEYIFSLSATNNRTHLCAMAELLEIFDKQESFDMLDQAENSDQVIVYLKENQ